MDWNRVKLLAAVLLINIIFPVFAAEHHATSASPIGYWKTIDDVTGKPKSIVQIWQADNQV